jgi:hypothetical protein
VRRFNGGWKRKNILQYNSKEQDYNSDTLAVDLKGSLSIQ